MSRITFDLGNEGRAARVGRTVAALGGSMTVAGSTATAEPEAWEQFLRFQFDSIDSQRQLIARYESERAAAASTEAPE